MMYVARARSRRTAFGLLTMVGVFSLWMREGFPVYAIRGSYADDHLFLTLARSISEGQWLGPFDDLTLVKGPIYPLFIVIAGMLHVPLKLAEQICMIAASTALCRWVTEPNVIGQRLAARSALGALLFVLLCFNPVLWSSPLARVIREGLYISLSLAVVTFTLWVCFPGRPSSTGRALMSGAGLGLVASAFWLTREEGLWLVPSVIVVVGIATANEWSRWRAARSWGAVLAYSERPVWRQLASFSAAAVICAIVTGTVATINLRHYGAFELNEVKSSAFTHAYGALSRIEPDQWQRYIVLPKDARDRAYAVSPAARELAPTFEGASGQHLAEVHCAEYLIMPCIGFHAGWFQWLLREAVRTAGHYGSAAESASFYKRLAREIDDACDAGSLRCLPPRNTLAPPFRPKYLTEALLEAWPAFQLLLGFGVNQIGSPPSAAIGGDLDAIADMVGPVRPGATTSMFLHGWAATPGLTPNIAIISRQDSARVSSSVDLLPDGGVELRYPGLHAIEFTIHTDCPRLDCDLVFSAMGQADVRVPVSSLIKDTILIDGVNKMSLDRVDELQPFPFRTMMMNAQSRLATQLALPYWAAHVLWPVALASLVLAFVLDLHRPKPLALYALALSSLTAVISRLALLSYLQITSIPSRNLLYLSPASPFLIIFIVTALFLGATSIACTLRGSRAAGYRGTATAPEPAP